MKTDVIGFIGLGLIGGSIARKIKNIYPDSTIIARSGRQSTISQAHDMGLIDNKEMIPMEDLAPCDLIFLCAPVEKNIEYLEQLKNVIKKDCIITDVGSTKTAIHQKARALGLEENFIGGHPMTGSEKTGLENANELMLENAYYIITPTAKTTSSDLSDFKALVKALGSIPLVLDYNEHDHATAAISHLPHMIAYSLVDLVKDIDSEKETMKTIAAGSFRDVTRIAASSPEMWQSICSSNRKQLVALMDMYQDKLDALKKIIESEDKDALLDYFGTAKEYRDSLTLPSPKNRTNYHEFFVDLADEAGGIAIIASLLAFRNISIKNIGIIHNREFEEGVLRIEFYDDSAMEAAARILSEKNYTIYRR